MSFPAHNPLNEALIAGTFSVIPPTASLDTSTHPDPAHQAWRTLPLLNISASSTPDTFNLPVHAPVCALSVTAGQALGQKNSGFLIWLGYSYMTPVTSVAGGLYSIWQNVINSLELYEQSHRTGKRINKH